MQIHELAPKHARPTKKIIGRGGKRGKTAGRGTKGQSARAGHRMRPELRDLIRKLPKRRGEGIKSSYSRRPVVKPVAINLTALNNAFPKGGAVTELGLLERGLLNRRGGKIPTVKILGEGEVTQALVLTGFKVSAAARAKIVAAGGQVN
jgi:large subunit ribosomal protein L15